LSQDCSTIGAFSVGAAVAGATSVAVAGAEAAGVIGLFFFSVSFLY